MVPVLSPATIALVSCLPRPLTPLPPTHFSSTMTPLHSVPITGKHPTPPLPANTIHQQHLKLCHSPSSIWFSSTPAPPAQRDPMGRREIIHVIKSWFALIILIMTHTSHLPTRTHCHIHMHIAHTTLPNPHPHQNTSQPADLQLSPGDAPQTSIYTHPTKVHTLFSGSSLCHLTSSLLPLPPSWHSPAVTGAH